MINQLIYRPSLTFRRLINILINTNKMRSGVSWDKACSNFVFKVTKAMRRIVSGVCPLVIQEAAPYL